MVFYNMITPNGFVRIAQHNVLYVTLTFLLPLKVPIEGAV